MCNNTYVRNIFTERNFHVEFFNALLDDLIKISSVNLQTKSVDLVQSYDSSYSVDIYF